MLYCLKTSIVLITVFMTACAGMDQQYQRNMAVNATGYGIVGSAVGPALQQQPMEVWAQVQELVTQQRCSISCCGDSSSTWAIC